MSSFPCDIMIKNGLVYQENGRLEKSNLVIANGLIAQSSTAAYNESVATKVVDASGAFVVPGLVDLHAHVLYGVAPLAVPADNYFLKSGVTTVVDAGSTGIDSLEKSLRVIADSPVRLFMLLHISRIGIPSLDMMGDLVDIRNAAVDETADAIRAHPDLILGVKVRYGPKRVIGNNGITVIELAKKAAQKAGCPLMVHIGFYPGTELKEILGLLESGDIVTHCYHDHDSLGITGQNGVILKEVEKARERGILFDVGHGKGSFGFSVARDAIKQGFEPDTISTDLHQKSINGPAYDMPTTMSKLLNLGMSPESILRKVTEAPARIIGRPDLGTLNEGTTADISIFTIEEGNYHFTDCYGNEADWPLHFFCLATIQNGCLVYDKTPTEGVG